MAKSKYWKPVTSLTPNDFERYSVWSFDSGKEGSSPDVDETWVRPIGHQGFDAMDDVLFARGTLTFPDGSSHIGCVAFRLMDFRGTKLVKLAKPKVQGVAQLQPVYSNLTTQVTPGPIGYHLSVAALGAEYVIQGESRADRYGFF